MLNVEMLPEASLRELCAAGASIRVAVCAMNDGGFVVRVSYGTANDAPAQKVLRTVRGSVKRFGSIDTVALYLKELGCPAFEVDMASYQPGLVRPPRPDRSEALRKTRIGPRQASFPL